MAVDYDEAFFPFQKFPADANRGIDAYPSRAIFTPLSSTTSTTLYSTSLLIMSPVPDMSMPFNVISLSCTLWAFVLGSLLNILVKRGTESIKREFTGEREKKPIDKLKEKLGKVKGLFRGKSVAEVSIGEEKKED
jgi:phosphatidylinositol glycan class T